jgi:transglutaminase-like putative cysteine protease
MDSIIPIDNQPIDATFFGEVRRLTDWITPGALEVQQLFQHLTENISNSRDRITSCWDWVTSQIKYVHSVRGTLCIDGKCFAQKDLWQEPSITIHTKIGNCANSAMLLASLVRNELPPQQAYCILGNLHSQQPGGHAWVKVSLDGDDFIMEATTNKVPPLVPEGVAARYEAVHYFNDKEVLAVVGKTQMVPYAVAYSNWLSDYLNWAYIDSQRRG